MNPYILKSAKIESNSDREPVLLFTFLEELEKGAVRPFGLVKLTGRQNPARVRLVKLIENALQDFCSNLEPNANIPRRFEKFMEQMRDTILDGVLDGAGIPLSDFHAVFGVVYKTNVLLAGVGKLTTLFMHKTAKERYVLYHLDQYFDDKDELSWKDILQSVLDGELHPGDVFYVGTRVPVNSISVDELQEILVTLPPAGAIERIKQYLGASTSYGAIAFQTKDPGVKQPKKENPLSSLEGLSATQEATTRVLGEQSPDIASIVNTLRKPIMQQLSSAGQSGLKSTVKRGLMIAVHLVSLIAIFFLNGAKLLLALLKRAFKPGSKPRSAMNDLSARLRTLYHDIRALPRPAKLASVFFAMLAVCVVIAISFANQSAKKKERFLVTETVLAKIDEKRNSAEASLIYDNTAQAKTFIGEAVALFDTIQERDRYASEIETLKASIDALSMRINGVTPVEATLLATGGATSLTEANGTIFVANGQTLSTVNGSELTPLAEPLTESPRQLTGEGGNVLALLSSGLVRIAGGIASPVVSGITSSNQATAIQLYNDTLYALSPSAQQIIKMRTQGSQYEGGTNWIIDRTTDIKLARDFAIDGDVYILNPNGIIRFRSGREQTFSLASVEPVLEDAREVWTSATSTSLYILDPSQKRVLVFTKEGALLAQYQNAELATATSMVVDEPNRRIIISNPTGIWTLVMP